MNFRMFAFSVSFGKDRSVAIRASIVVPWFVQAVVNVNPAVAVPIPGRKIRILGISALDIAVPGSLDKAYLLHLGRCQDQILRRGGNHRPVVQKAHALIVQVA